MNPICCLNPNCDNPSVPDTNRLCPDCQKPLVLLRHRYRPVKCLGQGGFGKTYLAMDNEKFGEKCVIKQLIPQGSNTHAAKKARELFEQEARQLQSLNNSRIPTLRSYFTEDNSLYLIQDFIDGENLLCELQRDGIFTEAKVVRLLRELLPVLKVVHRGGIIHRDIKPENLMRSRKDRRLFLIDFGASKEVQGTIRTGTIIGTHGYSPPEQMRDGKVYPASDLFSLGVTCFHLLTGIHPWDVWSLRGYGWVQEWRQHLKQPVGSKLGKVLDKLLSANIQERYQSAEEVLNAFNSSQPKKKPPPPRQPPPSRTGRTAVVQPPMPPQPGNWQPPSPTQPVVLSSDRGVDYSRLQDLLRQGKWEEANQETVKVMLKAANRGEFTFAFTPQSIKQFPCTDLRTIDQLWVKYSSGRFGFSVQKQIYQDCCGVQLNGKHPGKEIWVEFAGRVGWRQGDSWVHDNYLTFNPSAPLGHLPVPFGAVNFSRVLSGYLLAAFCVFVYAWVVGENMVLVGIAVGLVGGYMYYVCKSYRKKSLFLLYSRTANCNL